MRRGFVFCFLFCFVFFFTIQTSDRIVFALIKTILLQFFTILQDKLHSFNQSRTIEARSRFLCTTIYRTDHIIKRFHEENSA